MRKPKAHVLPESTREEMAKRYNSFKEKGVRTSYTAIAEMYHCTPEQVRSAVKDLEAGRFAGKRGKRTVKKETIPAGGTDEAFRQILDAATHGVHQHITDPVELVQLAERLARVRKLDQQTRLMGKLRSFDAALVIFFGQFVAEHCGRPTMTEEEAIELFELAEVAWKELDK